MKRRKKWDDRDLPLTEDWSNSLHSLASAAEILDQMSGAHPKLLKAEILREMRLILSRGASGAIEPSSSPPKCSVSSIGKREGR